MAADILDNLIVLRTTKKTKEEVLRVLSDAAIDAGYAKPGYHAAILEREEKYPTGLHIPKIEVAIPHADVEWTIKSSITVGILDEPVTFQPMGGEGGEVQAGLVFMLTIKDPKEHIDFLRAFTNLMGQETDVLIDFAKTGNPETIVQEIRKNMPDRTKGVKMGLTVRQRAEDL